MTRALDYLARLRARTGVHVTVTHITTRALALAVARFPQTNGFVARNHVYVRDDVDIFMQVSTEGGTDLSGIKIGRADQKTTLDIAREAAERIAVLRARKDKRVEQTKSLLGQIPRWALGRIVRGLGYLTYDWDVDLSRFGVVKDEFGSAMVTSVGMMGVRTAFAPLLPFSRCPIVVLVGEIEDRPIVEDGQVVVRPILSVGATLDHRLIDGAQGGQMIGIFREYFADPERFDGVLDAEPAAAISSSR
jgi:pyruvate dehydrogenase E2 component (dihydrolipoamide acetyltransferase)